MRISKLSELTGVSAASIKYYTREGLLPAGKQTGYNSTDYDETHVERLRLIRALISSGRMSITDAGRVIAALDDSQMELPQVLGIAQQALPHDVSNPSDTAQRAILNVMRTRGWVTARDNPGIKLAASVLDNLERTEHAEIIDQLPRYAEAMDLVAEADLDAVASSVSDDRQAETAVVGTALGDSLLAGLRRIAQEAHTRRRHPHAFGPEEMQNPK